MSYIFSGLKKKWNALAYFPFRTYLEPPSASVKLRGNIIDTLMIINPVIRAQETQKFFPRNNYFSSKQFNGDSFLSENCLSDSLILCLNYLPLKTFNSFTSTQVPSGKHRAVRCHREPDAGNPFPRTPPTPHVTNPHPRECQGGRPGTWCH